MTMRIGLLCHWGYGGSSKITLGLARELVAAGHRVHLFARLRPACRWDVPAGVELHDAPFAGGVTRPPDRLDIDWTPAELDDLTTRIVAVIKNEGLDILHFHYAVPFAVVAAGVRARLGPASPALVGTVHGTDVSVYGRDPSIGPTVSRALGALDALTTVSASHAALSTAVFALDRPPEVIANFVDLSRWSPRPAGAARGRRRPRIAHVSNFRPVKATPSVARVFAEARRQVDCALWLIGDGEEMPVVDAVLSEAGLMSDVRHFGLRPDVNEVLPQADLLLMTSRSESFCLAALEAQACGVPVVAPRVGGIPEVVDDGVTGLLFDPGDEGAAAKAVALILGDPENAVLMGKRGVERARNFSSTTVAERYAALYQRLLGLATGDHDA